MDELPGSAAFDAEALGRLIRQRGIPEEPRAAEQVSEVRSDCFVDPGKLLEAHAVFTLATVIIQWHFRLAYAKTVEFHNFLAENERFIADGCEKMLSGVHYRGTFMALAGKRAAYTTLWGYDSWNAQNEWSKILGDKKSRFYQAVRDLRSYWASDPDSTQEHFGAAAGIDLTREGFFAITIDADSGTPQPARRAPSARRKS